MTARASSPEYSCSSCSSLVLRGAAELAPACDDCGRVVCDYCEFSGRCAPCFQRHHTEPLELLDDDRETLVVVDGISEFGVRPVFSTQPDRETADDLA